MKLKMRNEVMRTAATALLSAMGVAVLLAGCSSYQLGSTLPGNLRTIHVPTFVNKTGEPLVESEATSATIQEFQKDGTLSVVPQDAADLVLDVVLTGFRLEPIRFSRENVKQTREYRLRIDARVTCLRAKDGNVLVSRTLFGESTFFPSGSMAVAKQQALPDAADDLARDIVSSVVEAW